ncbi:MAG: Wzz/FepE/Etk N-terminal domain-containing protein [Alkalibacterium sp.]|nr:Wzz/FepE/Etk N-terminal domain-containing protein [Alkalibacterium sp.]
MEEEISLVELFDIIKKRLALIINLTLLGILLAAVYTFFIAVPEYSSTTQLLVNRTQQTEVIQQSDINTNVQLINTYKDILKGPVITG